MMEKKCIALEVKGRVEILLQFRLYLFKYVKCYIVFPVYPHLF